MLSSPPNLRPIPWLLLLLACLATDLPLRRRVAALELSGATIFVCDPNSPADQCATGVMQIAWHTGLDDVAAPIGMLESIPPRSYRGALLNPLGGFSYPLKPGVYLFTALWQPQDGAFPLRLGVNLFFDRDSLTPGITAVVPTWAGLAFTLFRANTSPSTYSSYLREIDNPATLQYSDGTLAVTLSALLATHSSQLAPTDFLGLTAFGADHHLDALVVFELTVAPILPTPKPPKARRRGQPEAQLPTVIVGPDLAPAPDDPLPERSPLGSATAGASTPPGTRNTPTPITTTPIGSAPAAVTPARTTTAPAPATTVAAQPTFATPRGK